MRINAVIAEQPIKIEGLQDILSKLNVGDVVKAKVLEMTSGELMLKLFDGTVLKASTSSEIDTAPGEQLELAVKGRIDGKLILETIKNDIKKPAAQQSELETILLNLDLKPDARGLELAGEIKSSGLAATRQLFDKASEMLNKFNSLTPDKAIFLSSKNINPGPQNVNTVIRLVEGTLKLGSQLDELMDTISSIESRKNMDANIEDAAVRVSKTDTLEESNTALSMKNNAQPDDGVSAKGIINPDAKGKASASSINEKTQSQISLDSNNTGADNLEISKQPSATPSTSAEGKQVLGEAAEKATVKLSGTQDNEINIPKKSGLEKSEEAVVPKAPGLEDEKNGGMKVLKESDDKLLAAKTSVLKEIHKDSELLSKLKESFKSLFVKTDSDDLKNDLNVKQLYKDIVEKLDNMKATVQSLAIPEKSEIFNRISSIEDGINLLNQISTNSSYVQIPLNISGFNTTGELYIMKKEKSYKKIDPQNAVMLIALDTQNIGHIETLLDVKGKNVSINMRAEDQQVMDFIKENYRHLYSSLLDKGYRLVDIKYRLITEKANLVNAERTARKELIDGRTSVDFKV